MFPGFQVPARNDGMLPTSYALEWCHLFLEWLHSSYTELTLKKYVHVWLIMATPLLTIIPTPFILQRFLSLRLYQPHAFHGASFLYHYTQSTHSTVPTFLIPPCQPHAFNDAPLIVLPYIRPASAHVRRKRCAGWGANTPVIRRKPARNGIKSKNYGWF